MLRKDKTTPNRVYVFEFHVQLSFLTNVALKHFIFIYESDLQI